MPEAVDPAPSAPDASHFDTKPTDGPVRGDEQARFDLERAALSIAAARTPALVGDGRLGDLALAIARKVDPHETAPDLRALAPLARARGLVNELPQYLYVAAPTIEQARAYLVERGPPAAREHEVTHYGLAAKHRGNAWVCVLVLDRRPLTLDPLPTSLAAPGPVQVHARTHEAFNAPRLVVTAPDGNTQTVAQAQGSELVHTLELEHKGLWRVEIMADGERGPTVLANMTVAVAVERPNHAPRDSSVAPHEATAFVRELEQLITRSRAEAGLQGLERDEGLDRVALGHSTDMRDHRFFGHVSPSTGGPGERVMRAGVPAWGVRENLGRGYTPAEVHALLMESPAHRAALLAGDVERLGLGVVPSYEGRSVAWYVTELFARLPHPIDPAKALDDTARHVNAARAERGLNPLVAHEGLRRAAEAGAARFFAEPTLDEKALVEHTVRQSAKPRGARYAAARLFLAAEPSTIELTEELLDPAARWLGVGMATGQHPRTGPYGVSIVTIVA